MLTGLLVLFIVSSSVLATDNNASSTIVTDNNMTESSLSSHSTNETHNVNQSLMNMTMMTKNDGKLIPDWCSILIAINDTVMQCTPDCIIAAIYLVLIENVNYGSNWSG